MRGAVDRHLPLLHRFQQRRLRLGCRAIDLIGEHHLREDGAAAKLERALLRVVDADAGHVAGKQIRGELHALEGAPRRARHRLRQHGLAGAGHVLDQDVPAAEERDDAQLDLRLLADDDRADAGEKTPGHPLDVEAHGGLLRSPVEMAGLGSVPSIGARQRDPGISGRRAERHKRTKGGV